MRRSRVRNLKRLAAIVGSAGMVCQFGSCDLGQVTTTQTITLDGRDVIISLIRSAIITPLDEWVTNAVNEAFAEDA